MSDDVERERARYEALAALVDGYRRERDDAREQLYMTKAELGRWVDRETKAARERDEARAERDLARERFENVVQSATRYAVERDEARAEADRWKRSCNVFRERDWPKAFQATVTSLEQEVSDAHEQLAKLRKLSKPWEGDAYRRGAEAMREACADCVKHLSHEDGLGMGSQRLEGAIRAIPIPEEP
jgi:uncharacterized coiled-coil DUF342 family protein